MPVPMSGGEGKRILRERATAVEEDVDLQLQRFWEVDAFGVKVESTPVYTHREPAIMEMMKQTYRKVDSGYELGLLWKANRPRLPNNFDTALKRFESVEHCLQRDPKLP